MELHKNTHIKCILSNNISIEGYFISSSNDDIRIYSLDKKSVIVINNPKQNVILTKIFLQEEMEQKSEIKEQAPPILEEEKIEVVNNNNQENEDLKLKNLAELKILKNEQEKKIIAEKLRGHTITGASEVRYTIPSFFRINK